MDRQEALVEFRKMEAEKGRRTLLGFTAYTLPTFQPNWHHVALARALDQVLDGTIKRLMVLMPPQNGKTELVSRRFPAYALGKRPDLQLLATAYNASKATEESREVQQIINSQEYRRLFPGTRLALPTDIGDVRMAAQFDIPGHQGAYRAAGVGQGIAGKPMHLGIIDDPHRNREEAESETLRARAWSWYVGDFAARMTTDQTSVVLVQTRWHTDDLAGRLLALAEKDPKADQWTVISFPAIAEELRPDDPREIGDPLWPSRFSKDFLESRRVGAGVYDWSALYQQRPVPPGGAMAQRGWFPVMPARSAAGVVAACRCWDLAGTKPVHGRDPDWTVGTLVLRLASGYWVVAHVVRVRETPSRVDALIRSTALSDGKHVLVREWQDPGAAGKSVISSHKIMLAGWDYEGITTSGEKSMQWRPFLVQAEAGNVMLYPGAWNNEWLDEMSMVPYGLHDDQADSVAGAFKTLAELKVRGPSVAAVMPDGGAGRTAGGPEPGAWQEAYFHRR